jgi:hypothetical protein
MSDDHFPDGGDLFDMAKDGTHGTAPFPLHTSK